MVFHQLMKQGSAPVPRQRPPGALLLGQALVLLAILGGTVSSVLAQGGEDAALDIRLGGRGQRLELTVNTSQVLKPGKRIPRLFVANPEIIQATPLAEDEIQIAALTPGTTQLNLWDEQGQITTWDVLVSPDARQLREVLESEFPEATLRVRPLAKSVYITGYVPRPEMVHEITTLAKDYHKDVISGIVVGGVQQVALHVKVMEVSRTKLRQLGLDWEFLGEDISLNQGTGGLLAQAGLPPGGAPGNSGDTIRFAVFGDASVFLGYLQALRSQELIKILSEPTLVTMTGRPATFLSGGSFPIIVPSGLGNFTIQWRTYGTQVDFVPLVLGDGTIRLDVRGSVSELDESRGAELAGTKVPGVTERNVDTSVELQAGQSLALAGLIQNRVEANNRGVPLLADVPVVGRFFSRVEEKTNEVELLVIVTPELIAPLNPHELPPCGPGQLTTSPSDKELYGYGYLEVPSCAPGISPETCMPSLPLGNAPGLPAERMMPRGSADSSDGAFSTRPPAFAAPTRQIPHPAPLRGDPQAGTLPAVAAPSAVEARRPQLDGPIGYDPLP